MIYICLYYFFTHSCSHTLESLISLFLELSRLSHETLAFSGYYTYIFHRKSLVYLWKCFPLWFSLSFWVKSLLHVGIGTITVVFSLKSHIQLMNCVNRHEINSYTSIRCSTLRFWAVFRKTLIRVLEIFETLTQIGMY